MEQTMQETDETTEQEHTMKAIVQDKYGAPHDVLTLEEVEKPSIGDEDVLVQVRAAGVHIGDWLVGSGLPHMIRLGYGLTKPKNRTPGMEFSGQVEAVGENVAQFKPGDEVFGYSNAGAFAEYVSVSHDALALKPSNATFEQAAALPISGFTAIQALRDVGKVQQGQKVLVIGASGGVGTYAVQIAKAFGGEVTGVCSTRNVDMVRSIGADHVVDYTQQDIAGSGERYDLILDTAGNRPVSELRSVLTPTGTLVIVGGSGGPWLMGTGRSLRALAISPFTGQKLTMFLSRTSKEDLVALAELVDSEDVAPVIDATYPLSETAEALSHVGERHTRGKTVITVQ
ncbi:MAG: NAD(P)-dependent alcohol dehydrogenase [Actinomycetia bacterium]|nr:NAD(P)-dependent alcohol dehydrogenase [Actinomycetes bacterium]